MCALVLVVAAMLTGSTLRPVAGATTDDAVTYRIDAAHSGSQPADGLAPPLRRVWSIDLGGIVSYPLIVGGRVFVTAVDGSGFGSHLLALDAGTGRTLWGPVELGGPFAFSGAAYDGGRVFVVNFSGRLRALDAATGSVAWSVQLSQYAFTAPPTALDGVVYLSGAGYGGTVYAVSEATGSVIWAQPVTNGDRSAPAVSANGVYVTYLCQQDFAFDRLRGTPLWHHSTPCAGGGGATPALADGRVYDLDVGFAGSGALGREVELDAQSGNIVGSFLADYEPAFDGVLGFFVRSGMLSAAVTPTDVAVWGFTGDGTLNTAPVVAAGHVYVAGSSGMVYAVNELTGAQEWSQNLGAAPPSSCGVCPVGGLAVGDGILVVPMGTRLGAFGGGAAAG